MWLRILSDGLRSRWGWALMAAVVGLGGPAEAGWPGADAPVAVDAAVLAALAGRTPREVERESTKVLRAQPDGRGHALARLARGRARLLRGRYASAAFDLRRAERSGLLASADLALFLQAESRFHAGQYADAERLYRELLRGWPVSDWRHRAHFRLGDCRLGLGDASGAIKALTAALDQYPEYPYPYSAWLSLADAERLRGRSTAAAAWLSRVVREFPAESAAARVRAELAVLSADGVAPPVEAPEVRLARLSKLRQRKFFDAAAAELRELIDDEEIPLAVRLGARLQLGRTLLQMERLEEARAALDALAESTTQTRWRRRAWYWKSQVLERQGETDEAARIFLASQGDPARPDGTITEKVLWIYFNGARYEKAAEWAGKLYALGGEWAGRSRWLRVWLAYRLGDYKAAAEAFKRMHRASRARPDRYAYWLARTLIHQGDLDAAEATLSGIVQGSPLSYYAHLSRARLAELGRRAPPDQAREIDPDADDSDLSGTLNSKASGGDEDNGQVPDGDQGATGLDAPVARADVALLNSHEPIEGQTDGRPLVADPPVTPGAATSPALSVLARLADEAGGVLPALMVAYELAALGETTWAAWKLREVVDEIRAFQRAGGRSRWRYSPSPYVDYRKDADFAEWGRKRRNDDGVVSSSNRVRALRERRSGAFWRGLLDAFAALDDHHYVRRLMSKADRRTIYPPEKAENNPTWRRMYPRAYRDIVEPEAARYGLDPHLIWALMTVESTYNPRAISRAGARGPMQVMPHTGALVAQRMGQSQFGTTMLYEPEVALAHAAWYMDALVTKFNGQLPLAIPAYNAGPHRVASWLDRKGHLPLDEFVEEIPYAEAREYGKKVQRYLSIYRRTYGLDGKLEIQQVIDKNFKNNINF